MRFPGRDFICNENGFERNLLERKLLAGLRKEPHGDFVRFVSGAELNLHGAIPVLRKRFVHLAIENERGVGIQFFLKLEQLRFAPGPWTRFIHRQDKHVAAPIVGKRIQNSRVFHAHRALGQIFGNHW